MGRTAGWTGWAGVVSAVVLVAGCFPEPRCEQDTDCNKELGEACVDHHCQFGGRNSSSGGSSGQGGSSSAAGTSSSAAGTSSSRASSSALPPSSSGTSTAGSSSWEGSSSSGVTPPAAPELEVSGQGTTWHADVAAVAPGTRVLVFLQAGPSGSCGQAMFCACEGIPVESLELAASVELSVSPDSSNAVCAQAQDILTNQLSECVSKPFVAEVSEPSLSGPLAFAPGPGASTVLTWELSGVCSVVEQQLCASPWPDGCDAPDSPPWAAASSPWQVPQELEGQRVYASLRAMLKDGSSVSLSSVTERLPGPLVVRRMATGTGTSCAVLGDGELWCWGANDAGQLGQGSTSATLVQPVRVTPVGVPQQSVTRVAVGDAFVCAVVDQGNVQCWGKNSHGQAGGPAGIPNQKAPGQVKDTSQQLLVGAVDVVTGREHACALGVDGVVRCWGDNARGQMGDAAAGSHEARVVPLGQAAVALAAGALHTCAVTALGGVMCWGDNAAGQCGASSGSTPLPPAAVPSGLLAGVVAVTAGDGHTCALTAEGGVVCWGANGFYQLGTDQTVTPGEPRSADTLARAVAAGAGHTCVLTASGGATCWGDNRSLQLGAGEMTPSATPQVPGQLPQSVLSLALGAEQSCAVLANGQAWCWGNNASGQLGQGVAEANSGPSPVSVLQQRPRAGRGVAVGDAFSCGVDLAGKVSCWGRSDGGRLGFPALRPVLSAGPVDVPESSLLAAQVVAGQDFACFLEVAGGAWCWGNNEVQQLGTPAPSGNVNRVTAGEAFRQLSAGGGRFACGVGVDGSVTCWGANDFQQLGVSDGSRVSSALVFTVPVEFVSAGGAHACAVNAVHQVQCWGNNSSGQAGQIGVTTSLPQVVKDADMSPLAPIQDLAAGEAFTCARTAQGAVRCWGDNDLGQLGVAAVTQQPANPQSAVALSSPAAQVVAGQHHACALLVPQSPSDPAAARVECWGDNEVGQLGNSSPGHGPYLVLDQATHAVLEGAVSLAAGARHTCALMANGTTWCWGDNRDGQLGTALDVQGVTGAAPVLTFP